MFEMEGIVNEHLKPIKPCTNWLSNTVAYSYALYYTSQMSKCHTLTWKYQKLVIYLWNVYIICVSVSIETIMCKSTKSQSHKLCIKEILISTSLFHWLHIAVCFLHCGCWVNAIRVSNSLSTIRGAKKTVLTVLTLNFEFCFSNIFLVKIRRVSAWKSYTVHFANFSDALCVQISSVFYCF